MSDLAKWAKRGQSGGLGQTDKHCSPDDGTVAPVEHCSNQTLVPHGELKESYTSLKAWT
jgi:hypothetical protein